MLGIESGTRRDVDSAYASREDDRPGELVDDAHGGRRSVRQRAVVIVTTSLILSTRLEH
jgi:hypothetical protein